MDNRVLAVVQSYQDTQGKVVPEQQAREQITAREDWVKTMAAKVPKPSRRASSMSC